MSATKIIIDTNVQETWLAECPSTLVRFVARPDPRSRCPECHSIVYTRRHPLCGVCGSELPGKVLFSAGESARVELIMKQERERHRQWMQRLGGD